MSQWNSLIGRSLGQYQIVELIGEGGMAAVYKAWQPTLRRYVALKVLIPDLAGDAEFVRRFHQEAGDSRVFPGSGNGPGRQAHPASVRYGVGSW